MSVENRADRIVASEESGINEPTSNTVLTVTRSRRTRKSHDHAIKCPETARLKMDSAEGRWVRPNYNNSEDMMDNISSGIHYQDSFFPSPC